VAKFLKEIIINFKYGCVCFSVLRLQNFIIHNTLILIIIIIKKHNFKAIAYKFVVAFEQQQQYTERSGTRSCFLHSLQANSEYRKSGSRPLPFKYFPSHHSLFTLLFDTTYCYILKTMQSSLQVNKYVNK
jgi:hypothetical protein